MSSISAGRSAVRTRAARSEGWFAALGVKGRRAFRAAYTGYMLDAFDLIVLTLRGRLLRTTLAALFPGIIGSLAAAVGLGGAIAFGVFGYVLAMLSLLVLPETHGREIRAVE